MIMGRLAASCTMVGLMIPEILGLKMGHGVERLLETMTIIEIPCRVRGKHALTRDIMIVVYIVMSAFVCQ